MTRFLFVLLLVGCDDDKTPAGTTDAPAATPDTPVMGGRCGGKPLVGSCKRNDNTGCVETYGTFDATMAEMDCEGSGNATWSTSACATSGSVGGCERVAGSSCSVTWLFPPATSMQAMQACQGGTFVTP